MCPSLLRAALIAIALLVTAGAEADGQDRPANRPNVVLIMTDDQGYGDLGVHGNPIVRTPNIDALAANAAVLPNFYVSPVCTPTRACLMTGRYNYRTRAIDTFRGRAMMDTAETTIAELLRKAGYATGIFGKWHLGDCYPMRPIDQGFAESLVHRGGGIGQPSDPPGAEGKYTDATLFRNGQAEATKGYCTDVYFAEAMKWAQKASADGKPFFLYLPANCPHGPFDDVPPDKYAYYKEQRIAADRFPQKEGNPIPRAMDADIQARVYAMIENIDDNVGRLMTWLREQKLADNTLVIFMTDNGRATPGYNAGLRGNKSTVYEGGIRSPFFACWPGVLQPGVASDRIAAHIDLAPTILEICGVQPPADSNFDGRTIWPLLTRQEVAWPERTLFTQGHRGDEPVLYHNFAARAQKWKLVSATGFGSERLPTDGPRFELFDMERDPYEMKNVAAEHPDVMAELKSEYEKWFKDVSSTREENYVPPRIIVGSPQEKVTVLTRQDWRGAGWAASDEGHWLIEVARPGAYDIKLIVAPAKSERKVRLEIGDFSAAIALPPGATEHTFAMQRLPLGKQKLQAWVESADQRSGVRFVELMVCP
jgi:arylsulfatase A-like enzyme